MALETFSKSRAQEARANLDNMRLELEALVARIQALNDELQERCPHPDEHVKKLDSWYAKQAGMPKIILTHCGICGKTKSQKG